MNKFIGAVVMAVPMNCITDVAGPNTLVFATDLYHPIAIDAEIKSEEGLVDNSKVVRGCLGFLLEARLQAVVAFYAQDGESSILTGLCQPEKDGPEYALDCGADGKQHLGEGQYIKRYAAQQHDGASPEREGLEPSLAFLPDVDDGCFHIPVGLFVLCCHHVDRLSIHELDAI